MDNSEAMYWLAILQQANKGSKEAMEVLRQENELRTETNQPTIQEELKAVADRARKPQMGITDFGEITREELREILMKEKIIAKKN